MLPNSDDCPAKAAQFATHSSVALPVVADFGIPKLLIAAGALVTFRASVPETPVHKNDNPLASKGEIRLAKQRLIAPPSGNMGLTENLNQAQLSCLVSARAD